MVRFRFACRRLIAASLLAGGTVAALPADAGEPVYKDLERFGANPVDRPLADDRTRAGTAGTSPHPVRVFTRSPGYAGSDYGLGKPAFTGLGSRPDWGRSSD